MALTEKLRDAIKRPSPADLEQRLASAEADLTALRGRLEIAAFDMASDVHGADRRYAEIGAEVVLATERVEALRIAIPAARKNLEAEQARNRDAASKAKIEAVRQHLRLRDQAIAQFEVSIGEAVTAWKKACSQADKARLAAPSSVAFPERVAITSTPDINRAVAHELWRVGSDPQSLSGVHAFPGSKSPSVNQRHNLQAIPSISEVMKKATAAAMDIITGKASAADPVVLVPSVEPSSAPVHLAPNAPLTPVAGE